jgi:hypothetical protein
VVHSATRRLPVARSAFGSNFTDPCVRPVIT